MESKILFEKEVKIANEKRQLAIRIPAFIVNTLRIDSKKDKIKFALVEDEKGLSLAINLIKHEEENTK